MMKSPIPHLVIVAGGKGSRLAARFKDVPKVLVSVGGKPVLDHQLELAAAAGIEDVTIFTGHLAEKIAAHVGDGSRYGLKLRLLTESEPLGNAGAVVEALGSLPEHFLVLYGDVMLAADLGKLAQRHLERGADMTAFVHPNDHPQDSDLLEADDEGWVTAIHAKPHPAGRWFANLVNASLYAVRREGLRPWAKANRRLDFVNDIMAGLIARGRVHAYRSSEYIKDMGTPARLEAVEADWHAGKLDLSKIGAAAPAVFLDRDGTLNVEKGFLKRAEDLELVEGAGAALKNLRQAGYRLVVLTNQPVIARGEASEEEVAAIHRRLEWELGMAGAYLDGIYLCPHHPDRGFAGERSELKIACDCRKPALGLIRRACEELPIDMARSWMIGDQSRDIEMARRAELRSVLVRTGVAGDDGKFTAAPDFMASDIAAAAEIIVKREARA